MHDGLTARTVCKVLPKTTESDNEIQFVSEALPTILE